jgi:hypothetical protein
MFQSYRQVFDHDLLTDIFLLQPQFAIGTTKDVASAMPEFTQNDDEI